MEAIAMPHFPPIARFSVVISIVLAVSGCGTSDKGGGMPSGGSERKAPEPAVTGKIPTNDFSIYYNQQGTPKDAEASYAETIRKPLPLGDNENKQCSKITPSEPAKDEFKKLFDKNNGTKRQIRGQAKVLEQFDANGTSQGYICLKGPSGNDKWKDILSLDAYEDTSNTCPTTPVKYCPFTYGGVTYCRKC